MITQSIVDPDSIELLFKRPRVFMDSLDYTQLADELSYETEV